MVAKYRAGDVVNFYGGIISIIAVYGPGDYLITYGTGGGSQIRMTNSNFDANSTLISSTSNQISILPAPIASAPYNTDNTGIILPSTPAPTTHFTAPLASTGLLDAWASLLPPNTGISLVTAGSGTENITTTPYIPTPVTPEKAQAILTAQNPQPNTGLIGDSSQINLTNGDSWLNPGGAVTPQPAATGFLSGLSNITFILISVVVLIGFFVMGKRR